MAHLFELDPATRDAVTRALPSGEAVVWVTRPAPLSAALAALPLGLFGVPWLGFSLFWTWMAWSLSPDPFTAETLFEKVFGVLFPAFGLPFVAIGIGMAGAPVIAALTGGRTVYVVTRARLALVSSGGRLLREVRAADIEAVDVTQRRDGRGTVTVTGLVHWGDGRRLGSRKTKLLGVCDARIGAVYLEGLKTSGAARRTTEAREGALRGARARLLGALGRHVQSN